MQNPSSHHEQTKARVELFKASLPEESERGIILIGAAFIEEELEGMLRAYFPFIRSLQNSTSADTKKVDRVANDLFGAYKPLNTFAAKSDFAFSIGLVTDWEYRDIALLRKIRNKFAHQIGSSSLKSSSVVNLVKQFSGAKDVKRDAVIDRMTKLGYLIITRNVILSDKKLDANTKLVIMNFAAGDPYNLKRNT